MLPLITDNLLTLSWIIDGLSDVLNFIMMWICSLIYGVAGSLYDIFFAFSKLELNDNFANMYNIVFRLQVILGLFMLFKLTFSFFAYVISPNSLADKNKGVGNVVVTVFISIALFASVNFIFNKLLYPMQEAIIGDFVIEKLILGTDEGFQAKEGGVSYGQQITYMTWMQFFINNDGKTCLEKNATGCDKVDDAVSASIIGTPGATSKFVSVIKDENIETNGILAAIAGILLCIMLISFIIDVGVRAFKLLFLQIIAPIAFFAYIGASGYKNSVLSRWVEDLIKTFAGLFIRVAVLMLAVVIVSQLDSILTGLFDGDVHGLKRAVAYLLLLIAAYGFAKMVPDLISNLFGIKGDGLSINPFNRAGFGAFTGGLIGGIGGSIQGGITSAITGAAAGGPIGGIGGAIRGIITGGARGINQGRRAGSFGDIRNNLNNVMGANRTAAQNRAQNGGTIRRGMDAVRGNINNARTAGISPRLNRQHSNLSTINAAAGRGNTARQNILNNRLRGNVGGRRVENRNQYIDMRTENELARLNTTRDARNRFTDERLNDAQQIVDARNNIRQRYENEYENLTPAQRADLDNVMVTLDNGSTVSMTELSNAVERANQAVNNDEVASAIVANDEAQNAYDEARRMAEAEYRLEEYSVDNQDLNDISNVANNEREDFENMQSARNDIEAQRDNLEENNRDWIGGEFSDVERTSQRQMDELEQNPNYNAGGN